MSADTEQKLRSLKVEIEENSETIQRIVDQIIAKYNRGLDNLIEECRNLLDMKDRLSDEEVEDLTLRVPIFMYFGVQGLESLGILLDQAKTGKNISYNLAYSKASGTVGDKTAEAELRSLDEALMVVCYERAYKQLKQKMDVATQICQSTRKVLQKRISELDINKIDAKYSKGTRYAGEGES